MGPPQQRSILPTCLCAAFMCADHKSAKNDLTVLLFTLLGSVRVKRLELNVGEIDTRYNDRYVLK